MKKLKTSVQFFCILLLFILLASCSNNKSDTTNISDELRYYSSGKEIVFSGYEENIGDNIPIIKGEVAKIVALTFSDTNDFRNVEKAIDYEDIEEDDIYYGYVNYCVSNGYMSCDENYFGAYDNMTLEETSNILKIINQNDDSKIDVNEDNKDKPISYGLFTDLFIDTIDSLSSGQVYDKYNLIYNKPIILATNKDNNSLMEYVITDSGKYKATNLDLSNFRDVQIDMYHKNGEIVMLKNFIDNTPIIENAYLYEYNKDSITIFAGGVYREYKIINGSENENLVGSICDIKISGDVVQSVSINKNVSDLKVRQIDNKQIKLSDGNTYEFDENFKMYGSYGNTLTFENKKDIRVGAMAKFVTKDNKILGGIFENKAYPSTIRVVLNDSSYENLLHKEVIVSSNYGFEIAGEIYNANESITINEYNYDDYIIDDYVVIEPLNNGKIILESITRANGYKPAYNGTIEVCKVEGGFNIISDVTMDEYLYQVVPSEMPSSYGLEASKVQAICARTYAYKQYYNGAYEKYGANVDDSTSCQVYNNIPQTDISVKAVDETTDEIIVNNGVPVDAFFFSTTGGSTASAGDVWTTDVNSFPSNSVSYLEASSQYDGDYIDLSVESNADKFFKDTSVDAIEDDISWFRWNFEMQRDELSTSINNNLENRYTKRPDTILTKQEDGSFKSVPINSIGLIKDIEVVKRGSGGNVIIMDIIGSENTIRVYTEYNIRALIRPYQYISGKYPIKLNMVNTSMDNYSLMPSSFFTMDKLYDDNNNIQSVTFYGGGNGHCVGLSQNGAKNLLDEGESIDSVIAHYYEGSQVEKMGEF